MFNMATKSLQRIGLFSRGVILGTFTYYTTIMPSNIQLHTTDSWKCCKSHFQCCLVWSSQAASFSTLSINIKLLCLKALGKGLILTCVWSSPIVESSKNEICLDYPKVGTYRCITLKLLLQVSPLWLLWELFHFYSSLSYSIQCSEV